MYKIDWKYEHEVLNIHAKTALSSIILISCSKDSRFLLSEK